MLKLLSFLQKSSDEIIGIDLGTTFSCVSVYENGNAKIISNQEGRRTTPSVVGFTDSGEILVGDAALRQAVTNPVKTITHAKRFIGKDFDFVRKTKDAFKFPMIIRPNQAGQASFEIDGKTYLPQEISAHVLRKLREAAEDYLGKKVNKAIITVPAYFNESERQATIDAAKIAGIDVKALINEPTAAVLDYAKDLNDGETIIALDFGGGTYDISVLKVSDMAFEIIATGGNNYLGGIDIDLAFVDLLADEFKNLHGINLLDKPDARARLHEACVKAKIELSSANETTVHERYIYQTESGPIHFERSIKREEFEVKILAPIIKSLIEPISGVLESANLSKSQIDKILLVGGSTRIPAFQEAFKKFFGKPVLSNFNLDEGVASGAAIQAAIRKGEIKKEIFDVTAQNLGVDVIGGKTSVIIEANHRVPTGERTRRYKTTTDNQTEIEVVVRQGMSPLADENHKLASFIIEGLPPKPAGEVQIDISFSLDGNGIIEVTAKDNEGIERNVRIEESSKLKREEIDRAIAESILKVEERRRLSVARKDLNNKIEEASKALQYLPEAKKEAASRAIAEAKESLQNEIKPKALKKKSREIAEAIEPSKDLVVSE